MDEVVIAYDDVTDSEIKSLLEEDLNEFKLDINRLNQFCNEMLSKNDKLFLILPTPKSGINAVKSML